MNPNPNPNLSSEENQNQSGPTSRSIDTPERNSGPSFTPGPYERDGCTIYKLEGTGRYSGKGADHKEDQANRFTVQVQGNRVVRQRKKKR